MPLRQCSGQALATAGRMPALHCNAFAQFVRRKPRDADDFIPAALAGGNGNGRSRHLQKFREEFDAGLVGSIIYRRTGQRNFERIANLAVESILFGPRMNSYGKRYSAARNPKRDHGYYSLFRVPAVVSVLLFLRRSPFPRARRSILLRSPLRSRVTCPLKARPF